MLENTQEDQQLIALGAGKTLAMANFAREYCKHLCLQYKCKLSSVGSARVALDTMLQLEDLDGEMSAAIEYAARLLQGLHVGDIDKTVATMQRDIRHFMSL